MKCPVGRNGLMCSMIFLSLMIPAAYLRAQSVIENPSRPVGAPEAGRTITLKEVQRITDQEGRFSFEDPSDILVGKDGCVLVQDRKQCLKFDASGKFVGNLLKLGQGPGELVDLTDVLVTDKEIILYSSNVCRAVFLSLRGDVLGTKSMARPLRDLVAYRGETIYLIESDKINVLEYIKNTGIKERGYQLVKVDGKGAIVPTSVRLPLTVSTMEGSSISINLLQRADVDERSVFVNHTPGYLVDLVDLESGTIVRSFRREYERVPYKKKERSKNIPKNYTLPEAPKFYNDIRRLLVRGDKLWVVTSTIDQTKGILVDVFDRIGRYLDNFYLPISNISRENLGYFVVMAVSGDFL